MWKITYFKIFIGLIFFCLLAKCLIKEEINCGLRDTIDHRHELIDSLYNQLDSLYKVIDTLQWEKSVFDYNVTDNTKILSALMMVESSNNDSAHAVGEDAVGILQIRKCMVDDINRILQRKKSPIKFTYEDRWSRYKSIKMFEIYCKHYGLTTYEEIARCWNGGPQGINNPATANYWKKVQYQINS
jgi:hypothetical protein